MNYFQYSGSGPKKNKEGIRLQSTRGGVGQTWWGQRWVAALEKLCDSGRLLRGKNYARQGQVISIEITPGRVLAKVQGTRPKPYTVTIELPLLKQAAWKQVQKSLSNSPLHLARLLAGDLSAELELGLQRAGVNLFPEKKTDLETDCSCPDWSDPCKHIAAVYYLLAEQFDADPFLLFRLRGQDREALLASLSPTLPGQADRTAAASACGSVSPEALFPLNPDPTAFWQAKPLPPLEPPRLPAQSAPLLQRLKSPPHWRGEQLFVPSLKPLYEQASQKAMDMLNLEPPER